MFSGGDPGNSVEGHRAARYVFLGRIGGWIGLRGAYYSVMPLSFVKMHGAGNDYVYVDATRQALPEDLPGLARRISDRHYGVGGDGLICLLPPEPGVAADVRMRMWNNDGSESELCGNGIRCVAKLAWDDGLARANPMKIQTGRGVLSLDLQIGPDNKVSAATVNMGEPILELDRIGVGSCDA